MGAIFKADPGVELRVIRAGSDPDNAVRPALGQECPGPISTEPASHGQAVKARSLDGWIRDQQIAQFLAVALRRSRWFIEKELAAVKSQA